MESGFKFNFPLPDAAVLLSLFNTGQSRRQERGTRLGAEEAAEDTAWLWVLLWRIGAHHHDPEALHSEAGRSLSPSLYCPSAATDPRRAAAEVVASLIHTEKQQQQLLAPETLVLDDGTVICWCNPKHVETALLSTYGGSSSESAAVFAHSAHSDLIPSVYEGGLKIWECAHDLLEYLAHQNMLFEGKRVLELGCGFGLPGLYALRRGACVDFQDYNTEVIELATIPNAYLNLESSIDDVRARCHFFSGDWESVTDRYLDCTTSGADGYGGRSVDGGGRYDFILTTETIYNPKSYSTLHLLFDRVLATDGQIYVAAKAYYFGVGGTTGDFRDYVLSKGVFSVSSVVVSCEGVPREILCMKRLKINEAKS